jgi:hypothetical protein
MTYTKLPARAGRLAALPLTAFALTLGCSRAELLEVNTPDQIPPEAVNNPPGAAALRVSALGNFANFYSGDVAGSGIGMNIAAGLLSDEMTTHRGGTEHMDSRGVNENTFPSTVWSTVGQAHTQLVRARRSLESAVPDSPTRAAQLAQLQALEGYVYLITGETYCNGVPFGNVDDENPATEVFTNNELFTRAVAAFDSSLTAAGDDADSRSLALVGKGRALVDLGQYDAAAQAVAAVPTDFLFQVQHSKTTIINDVYDWMVGTRNFGVVDKEGQNGLDYLSAGDPRIQFDPTPRPGQDGSLTIAPMIYPAGDSPVVLASGIEARMIEAEAELASGDVTAFLALLNTARATMPELAPLTDPGSPNARVDMLFRERAFWFWLTAHRLGDMRRLIRQYGRDSESVFPTGPYFKGGLYGTDVNLIPSNAERNNSAYSGCADRNP